MQMVLVLSMCSSFHMCIMLILEEHNFIIFIMYLLNCVYCIQFWYTYFKNFKVFEILMQLYLMEMPKTCTCIFTVPVYLLINYKCKHMIHRNQHYLIHLNYRYSVCRKIKIKSDKSKFSYWFSLPKVPLKPVLYWSKSFLKKTPNL